MKQEIWRPVPLKDFSEIYEISNLGQVKSISRVLKYIHRGIPTTRVTKSFILKQQVSNDGYHNVQIKNFTDGKGLKTIKVHRLVALAFIPNPDEKRCINHINGIKSDNSSDNLEWCTHSENMKHAHDTGLQNNPRGKKHYNSKKVIDTKTGEIFGHVREASKKYGLSYSTLVQYLNGGRINKTTLEYLK